LIIGFRGCLGLCHYSNGTVVKLPEYIHNMLFCEAARLKGHPNPVVQMLALWRGCLFKNSTPQNMANGGEFAIFEAL
jgi:hypothetical protein